MSYFCLFILHTAECLYIKVAQRENQALLVTERENKRDRENFFLAWIMRYDRFVPFFFRWLLIVESFEVQQSNFPNIHLYNKMLFNFLSLSHTLCLYVDFGGLCSKYLEDDSCVFYSISKCYKLIRIQNIFFAEVSNIFSCISIIDGDYSSFSKYNSSRSLNFSD